MDTEATHVLLVGGTGRFGHSSPRRSSPSRASTFMCWCVPARVASRWSGSRTRGDARRGLARGCPLARLGGGGHGRRRLRGARRAGSVVDGNSGCWMRPGGTESCASSPRTTRRTSSSSGGRGLAARLAPARRGGRGAERGAVHVHPLRRLHGSRAVAVAHVFDLERGQVAYWGTGDEPFDVTAMGNVARWVAEAVVDPRAENRRLELVGDVVTVNEVSRLYKELTGRQLQRVPGARSRSCATTSRARDPGAASREEPPCSRTSSCSSRGRGGCASRTTRSSPASAP